MLALQALAWLWALRTLVRIRLTPVPTASHAGRGTP
jgi:hypothetical protein